MYYIAGCYANMGVLWYKLLDGTVRHGRRAPFGVLWLLSSSYTSEKRSMSWYMAKLSTPTKERCTGEAVPGVVVKISLQLPSTSELEAASGTPPSSSRASMALSTRARCSEEASLLRQRGRLRLGPELGFHTTSCHSCCSIAA